MKKLYLLLPILFLIYWFCGYDSSNSEEVVTFESVFNITVSEYYESVKTYPVDIYEVLPSDSLTIEQIFD